MSTALRSSDSKLRSRKADSPGNGVAEPSRQHAPHRKEQKPSAVNAAIARSTIPEWLNVTIMMTFIFGGCCSNVYALEAIIRAAPSSGTLITCFQFLLTSLLTLPSHLDLSRGIRHLYLKPRGIPFTTWLAYTAFFVTVNLLNNKAFDYSISVPLHIILRSAGPVATMIVHRVLGRRYSSRKVTAVIILFVGVVQAAIADALSKSHDVQLMSSSSEKTTEFWTGFGILYLALLISAFMGVFTDRMYAKYGQGHTAENLFYSHTLSLPFFLAQTTTLRSQSQELFASPSTTSLFSSETLEKTPFLISSGLQHVPLQVLLLIMNGVTQYICIRGVNQLSARSSSLTVGVVLNIRKLISLLLSIWLFGHRLAPGVIIGAALVFLGGGLYAVPEETSITSVSPKNGKKEL